MNTQSVSETSQNDPTHVQAVPVQAVPVQAAPAAPTSLPQNQSSANDTELAQAESPPLLAQSIRDAYVLLDFTCRKGTAPPASLSQVVIDSLHSVESGTAISAEKEAAFWAAFAQLTRQVNPVTVESIRFTRPEPTTDHATQGRASFFSVVQSAGQAGNALRNYLVAAIATLLVLLALQVEWAIGTFIYNDAFTVHHHLTQGKIDLLAAEQAFDDVKGTPAAQQAALKLQEIQANALQDQSWSDVSVVRLQWWNRGTAAYIPPFDLIISHQDVGRDGGMSLDASGKQRLEFTRTELTLQVISNYYLVTLFALLGGLTQALRSLSQQIQGVSLTDNDLYRTRTRVILGIISGVCMAWLYIIATNSVEPTADNRTPLSAINLLGAFTPWAIAFVSGYSVEIFFTLLERVIAIATRKIKGLDVEPNQKPIPLDVAASTDTQPSPNPPKPAPAPASAQPIANPTPASG